jgi:MarR family transcriptional regulator, 2-MHQ and catechol-resistance regulon repressor
MPPPLEIGLQNYSLIQQIFLLGDDLDRRLLAGFGLSVSRFNLLRHLAENGPLTATDLCRKLLCDKANVTRLLAGLEQDGLVRREPDAADGRRAVVTLTPAGRQRLDTANAAYQASVLQRAAGFTTQEKLTLNELLALLKAALEEQLAREETL